MVNKNIQMKKKENDSWVNLFPLTLTENVYNNEGKPLESVMSDFQDDVKTDFINFSQQVNNSVDTKLTDFDNRIKERISLSNYNVDPTGKKDSYSGFTQALNELPNYGVLVLEPNGQYRLSQKVELTANKHITIEGNGATLLSEVGSGGHDISRALSFRGIHSHDISLTNGLKMGTNTVNVSSTSNIGVNDILYIQSEETFNSSRSYYKKGGMVSVGHIISGTQLKINEVLPYDIDGTVVTKISVLKPITANVKDLTIKGTHPTPLGYFGLAIENSLNSTITNVFSDNFNHCFHVRKHINTIASHLKSGRSMFTGSGESYGFASYIGTNLSVRHSVFNSGRHGLEISGFENSFKTTIENVTASSETGNMSFNLHQANYDVIIRNSKFDSIGLAGHVIMENCIIGNKTRNNIKTGIRYGDTSYMFKNCLFTGTATIIRITDDSQVNPNNSNLIGGVFFENCRSENRIQLEMFNENFKSVLDILTIKNTNDVSLNVSNNCRINKTIIENVVIGHNENFIVGSSGRLSELILRDCRLQQRYNAIVMNSFFRILFDNVTVDRVESVTNPKIELNSRDGSNEPSGEVTLSNSNMRLFTLFTGGFQTLKLINSELSFESSQRNNITNILGTTLTNLKA